MKYLLVASTTMAMAATMAGATTVNDFGIGSSWSANVQTGGTADVVDLTGTGGNLEANAPDSNGAAKITTADDNNSRGEAFTSGNFGVVSDIFDADLQFQYSWYNDGANPAPAAPAFKLAFWDPTYAGDGYGQLVYEPYWQGAGGTTTTPVTDDWVTASIDLNTGYFWNTGMFGIGSSAGGPPLRTLSGWLAAFNAADPSGFADSTMVGVAIGLGTYNRNEIGFFDDVRISGTLADANYDFAAAAPIPLPAALPFLLTALGGLGLVARRRRKAVQ